MVGVFFWGGGFLLLSTRFHDLADRHDTEHEVWQKKSCMFVYKYMYFMTWGVLFKCSFKYIH